MLVNISKKFIVYSFNVQKLFHSAQYSEIRLNELFVDIRLENYSHMYLTLDI